MRFEHSGFSGGPASPGRGALGRAAYINVSCLELILGFIAVCWMGAGCGLQPACSTCGVAKWTKFSPANERYSVLMPCRPEASTGNMDAPVGPVPASVLLAKASKGYGFAVVQCTLPPEVNVSDPKQYFDKMLKGLPGGAGGVRLVSSMEVALHGIPGRELVFEKSGQWLVTSRVYLVGRECYQAYAVMPKGRECMQHAREFVESFDLKPQ